MREIDTFVIGDIHGRADLLQTLLDELPHIASGPYQVVFLGDLIDRGPESSGVVDIVIGTIKTLPGSKLVMGNHESILLEFLDDPIPRPLAFDRWLFEHGGAATVSSYGIEPTAATPETLRRQLRADHIEFFRQAERFVEMDNHILVHAGLRPGIPLAQQSHYDLMWIREPFLNYTFPFEKLVIHGHTITPWQLPQHLENRIAIDTGAYASGVLTAAHIFGKRRSVELYHTLSDGSGVEEFPVWNWHKAFEGDTEGDVGVGPALSGK